MLELCEIYDKKSNRDITRIVAQPGRALRSGRRSRWFESSQSDHMGKLGFLKSKLNGSDKEILAFLLSKTQFETRILKN